MSKKIIFIILIMVIALGAGYLALKQLKEEPAPVKTSEEKNSEVVMPFQCPQYTPSAPGWCSDGKIIQRGDDERGCPQPPRCERSSKETQEKPPIVEHFACSDYCPGPQEKYMVKIYQGIEDKEECRRIGGNPYVYYGWGEFHICLAD